MLKTLIFLDVPECIEVPDICGPGNCTNTVGGYACICPSGYIPANRARECKGILVKLK